MSDTLNTTFFEVEKQFSFTILTSLVNETWELEGIRTHPQAHKCQATFPVVKICLDFLHLFVRLKALVNLSVV